MNIETIRQLSLARDLYDLGITSLTSNNNLRLYSAANLLQDAVEIFLIAVASHVNAQIDMNTKFNQYIDRINDSIKPKELPFKAKLLMLNKIRVNSKHYGIQPEREGLTRISLTIRELFEEVSTVILGVNFFTICAIDMIDDGEVKNILLEAKTNYEHRYYAQCAINCRKAIYIEIESKYNIYPYKDRNVATPLGLGLSSHYCFAPYYTKNSKYIEENVENSTDYIVFDHSHLEHELLTQGVLVSDFWNIWRLTPSMFRDPNKQWVVKDDFDKLDEKVLDDNIDYIFSKTIEIVLSLHAARRRIMWSSSGTKWFIKLNQEKVPLHEKADENSSIVEYTPEGLCKVHVSFSIRGINDDSEYWHVSHFDDGVFLSGYLHSKYIASESDTT